MCEVVDLNKFKRKKQEKALELKHRAIDHHIWMPAMGLQYEPSSPDWNKDTLIDFITGKHTGDKYVPDTE